MVSLNSIIQNYYCKGFFKKWNAKYTLFSIKPYKKIFSIKSLLVINYVTLEAAISKISKLL